MTDPTTTRVPTTPMRKELATGPGFERLTYFDGDTGDLKASSITGPGLSIRFPDTSPECVLAALHGYVDQVQDSPAACRELGDVLAHLDQASRYFTMRQERIAAEVAGAEAPGAVGG